MSKKIARRRNEIAYAQFQERSITCCQLIHQAWSVKTSLPARATGQTFQTQIQVRQNSFSNQPD